MPPVARALLVTTLITHPWTFVVATPLWVLAFTAPMDASSAPRPARGPRRAPSPRAP
jgi:hypothetical protein